MPILETILLFLWEVIKSWGTLFAAPFANLEMLWIIIPTYLNWFFAEFFQEKKGTSLGNAISNATIVLWVAIDWSRTSTRFYFDEAISTLHLVGNIMASVLVFAYGIWVVYEGVKGKNIAHFIGRVRVVTYIILMITPLIYNLPIHLGTAIIAMILLFPVYYFLIEFLNNLLPDPASIKEDEIRSGLNHGTGIENTPDLGSFGLGNFSMKDQKLENFKNFRL